MEPLWAPSVARIEQATITDFARRVGLGVAANDYHALWRWSVDQKEAFWSELWDYAGVIGEKGARVLIDGHKMPGARWFPDASLNFARNLLERLPDDDAHDVLVFWGYNYGGAWRGLYNGALLNDLSEFTFDYSNGKPGHGTPLWHNIASSKWVNL